MQERLKTLVQRYSILIQDWLKYELSLNRFCYLQIRNRLERLGAGPRTNSYVCLWPYTSRLKAVEEWPFIGRLLLKRTLEDNIFCFEEERTIGKRIDLSIIIGHKGNGRKDLLLSTLRSLAAQEGVSLECIVVEQDSRPIIKKDLPAWVDYVFQEVSYEYQYNRAAAFNLGARLAKGDILLLHDNDMIVGIHYCRELVALAREGYEALNTKRYVFYLSKEVSGKGIQSPQEIKDSTPLYVVQNLEAGGSMAITKKAYFEIGGMDEDFVGWGGEDNEFWQRCSTLKRWIWGFSPVIHLWHESQPLKDEKDNHNIVLARMLEKENIHTRIKKLRERNKMLDSLEGGIIKPKH